jgi:hypothetical protein
MENWTPDQWLAFLGGAVALLGTLAGTITTVILQLRTNTKVEAARAISTDTNQKTTAIVAQTRNIADAVPGASTDPTDVVIQRGEAAPGAQRATDPLPGA